MVRSYYVIGFNEKAVQDCNQAACFVDELDNHTENIDFTAIDQGWLYRSYVCQGGIVVKNLLNGTRTTYTFPEAHLEVKCVSTGFKEVYVVFGDGSCWFGKLHDEMRVLEKNKLEKVTTADVTSVRAKCVDASGDTKTVILFEDGLVGEIVCKDGVRTAIPIPTTAKIHSVACGKEHTILLSLDGKVFSYGFGSRGQLGHGHVENLAEPTLVEALDGIVIDSIAAGGWHSAAVSHEGDAYIWGWNESGQLGFPIEASQGISKEEVVTMQVVPRLLDFSDEIACVGCGSRHTVALTMGGILWAWGSNSYGQLGLTHPVQKPTPVPLPETVKSPFGICARHWNTVISVLT